MYFLNKDLVFPPVSAASPEGVVAAGGDLRPDRLLLAYRSGIFPWFEDGSPILWWSPDPRMVLFPEELKIRKSMRQFMRNTTWKVTRNKAFRQVIRECALIKRPGQAGTWITAEMIEAYTHLHEMGYAQSVEVWEEDELIGGLYGIDLGHVFCGESMFARKSNASKLGFVKLVETLRDENYALIDCQVYTEHLASLGAREIDREEFMQILNND
ncbi:leucyl/phenylalanyl-tRNA--protein transferase [Robertkochia marina]|uniref:Leucyl/phenylalanyl-tRNA--protein transferase n=1 Tax=Robertkochia marina TaxID=1227945 RepID=A0A4S3M612_9FLAO|nr:leucyl/phenylalanyl-tRNA--protein transferase [Robertkochia marina]THD69657.1 leucyl/phenylalanyl-tRNA--protein transferase [Robertkochia marina]TRZ46998.1 leucyl/phenylalanyl-tRNA--protein transferase [Robertkochia marina]